MCGPCCCTMCNTHVGIIKGRLFVQFKAIVCNTVLVKYLKWHYTLLLLNRKCYSNTVVVRQLRPATISTAMFAFKQVVFFISLPVYPFAPIAPQVTGDAHLVT